MFTINSAPYDRTFKSNEECILKLTVGSPESYQIQLQISRDGSLFLTQHMDGEIINDSRTSSAEKRILADGKDNRVALRVKNQ
jgi:hypothetical protein